MLLEHILLEDRADFIAQQMGPKLVARFQQDAGRKAEPVFFTNAWSASEYKSHFGLA